MRCGVCVCMEKMVMRRVVIGIMGLLFVAVAVCALKTRHPREVSRHTKEPIGFPPTPNGSLESHRNLLVEGSERSTRRSDTNGGPIGWGAGGCSFIEQLKGVWMVLGKVDKETPLAE